LATAQQYFLRQELLYKKISILSTLYFTIFKIILKGVLYN